MCLCLAKIGKAAESDRENIQEAIGQTEISIPEIQIPETKCSILEEMVYRPSK